LRHGGYYIVATGIHAKAVNWINLKIRIQKFSRSLITNLKSDFENLKWRIQDDRQN